MPVRWMSERWSTRTESAHLVAAEPEQHDPALAQYEFTIPDIQQSLQRFQQTPYYRIYQTLLKSDLGPHISEGLAKMDQNLTEETGLSLEQWLSAGKSIDGSFEMSASPMPEPIGSTTVFFHQHHETFWKLISQEADEQPAGNTLIFNEKVSIRQGSDKRGPYWHIVTDGADKQAMPIFSSNADRLRCVVSNYI